MGGLRASRWRWHLGEVLIVNEVLRCPSAGGGLSMSLHPDPIGEIPSETARVARAAFPKGTLAMRLR